MGDRAYLSIGEVLTLLRDEFPDVTISKIRFLESQGLLDPERTASGYRKFYEPDVERLRWILRQQREHFLPLKVIKGRLGVSPGEDAADDGSVSVGPRRRPVDGSAMTNPAPPAAPHASAAPDPSAPPAAIAPAPIAAERAAPPAAFPSAVPAPVAAAGEVPAAVAVAPWAAPTPEPPMPAAGGGNAAAAAPDPPPAPPVVAGPAAAGRAVPAPSPPPPVAAPPAAPGRQVRLPPPAPPPAPPSGATPSPPARPAAGPPTLSPPAKDAAQPATASFTSSLSAGMTGVSLTIEELASATGLPYERLRELEKYGFIAGRPVAGTVYYDEESLVVANLAVGFARFGIEGRHLRIYKNSAEREAGLFEQIVTPLLKQRNPEARRQAVESLEELTRLGQSLRAAVLRQSLRRLSGG